LSTFRDHEGLTSPFGLFFALRLHAYLNRKLNKKIRAEKLQNTEKKTSKNPTNTFGSRNVHHFGSRNVHNSPICLAPVKALNFRYTGSFVANPCIVGHFAYEFKLPDTDLYRGLSLISVLTSKAHAPCNTL
jgi:hypothetical protein